MEFLFLMELSPSVYEHAAAVIGRTPWEVSRDPELLFAAHAEAYRVYRQTPIMPGIDIYNLEAEAYGGVVENPGGFGIPAISRPMLRLGRRPAAARAARPAHATAAFRWQIRRGRPAGPRVSRDPGPRAGERAVLDRQQPGGLREPAVRRGRPIRTAWPRP